MEVDSYESSVLFCNNWKWCLIIFYSDRAGECAPLT